MSHQSVYSEIRHYINSGEVSSLSAEKLEKFASALARPNAYTNYSANQFPQFCETINLHLAAKLQTDLSTKIPNPAPNPPGKITNTPNDWHNMPLGKIAIGTVSAILAALCIYLVGRYFGIIL